MKYRIIYALVIALLLVLLASVSTAGKVIPTNGEKPVDNSIQNEQPSPTPNIEVQASQAPKESAGASNVRPQGKGGGSQGNEGVDAGKSGCGEEDAAKAGWKLLSCDPLRLMPLEEWNQKSANPHFRWRPELYCFDESNFAGIFHEVPPVDFPDPNWLSEVKLENGCSFFFHPNQGQGNGAPDERG